MTAPLLNPECAEGKCRNCNGFALDAVTDDFVPCQHECHAPEPPKHVHRWWDSKWFEEGILQSCRDTSCRETRMAYYR